MIMTTTVHNNAALEWFALVCVGLHDLDLPTVIYVRFQVTINLNSIILFTTRPNSWKGSEKSSCNDECR